MTGFAGFWHVSEIIKMSLSARPLYNSYTLYFSHKDEEETKTSQVRKKSSPPQAEKESEVAL